MTGPMELALSLEGRRIPTTDGHYLLRLSKTELDTVEAALRNVAQDEDTGKVVPLARVWNGPPDGRGTQ